ncbi:NAD(P)H-binding protein [Actinoplanes bogorensis]|uniref:NAD(P)H-binding protein n=1 Tax=Paractinoplanes bogorensis TaxID=1610840 RepID=A0ABS5YRI9_9ACTN|nr:NAD(P)H-binding protein [Actinoplanes bogorensis]MBU2665344.1 NAD(P)H-binding protein [Actinoplanes bogorensis]
MRILVLGATGFVGRRLVAALQQAGHEVRCLARDPRKAEGPGVEVVKGDMLDPEAVSRAVDGVHAVYFCVHTLSKQADPSADFMDVERTGLRNVIDAAQRHGVRRVVYVTAIGTDPASVNSWARGRAQTERMLFDSGLDATVLRPGMIVGHGGDGFAMVERGARSRVAVLMASRRTRFRTIAVDDLAGALTDVLDEPRAYGKAFDVGSDDVLTIDEMIDIAADHLSRKHPVKVHLPRRALAVVGPLIERVAGMPRGAVGAFVGPGSEADLVGDAKPIRALLTSPPRSFRESL